MVYGAIDLHTVAVRFGESNLDIFVSPCPCGCSLLAS